VPAKLARNAVSAHAASGPAIRNKQKTAGADTSDSALLTLLSRLKAAKGPAEIRRLSGQLERLIFHKQFRNA
jgi:hypothetical protein